MSIVVPSNNATSLSDSAYLEDLTLVSITIANSVTDIGDNVFVSCSNLDTGVIIPARVLSMGVGVFDSCTHLPSVQIKGRISNLGKSTFRGCVRLETVELPDSLLQIDDMAFLNCSSLASITIPDGVTTIGDCAFMGCASLMSVRIPESVTSIGTKAFMGCTKLMEVEMSSKVTTIDPSTFMNCGAVMRVSLLVDTFANAASISIPDGITHLLSSVPNSIQSVTSVSIPPSVTSIGDFVFMGSGITSVEMKVGLTHIGAGAFQGCLSLTTVTLPETGLTTIGKGAFEKCSSLIELFIPEGLTKISENMLRDCISLKSVHLPVSATTIGHGAFGNCRGVTSVVLPDSVTFIGIRTFSGCSALNDVHLSVGLEIMDQFAFENCSSLTTLTLPESIRSIGRHAFLNCIRLHTIVQLNSKVTRIDMGTYRGCVALTSISIPTSVTSIDSEAFYDCMSLMHLRIPESVTSIGTHAFRNCKRLSTLMLSNSRVTRIEDDICSGCWALNTVSIPVGVTSIGPRAFNDCRALESIELPVGVVTIGANAFAGCWKLVKVIIPESVASIGDKVFMDCTALAAAVLSNNVTTIGIEVFHGCIALNSVDSGVSTISEGMFRDCVNLTVVHLPDTITSIGTEAFDGCSTLESVVIPSSVQTIGTNLFRNCKNLIRVVVTGSSVLSVSFVEDILTINTMLVVYVDTEAYRNTFPIEWLDRILVWSRANIGLSSIYFDRFVRTSTLFDNRSILAPFVGSKISLYSNEMQPLYPQWADGINPLRRKVQWGHLRTTFVNNTVMELIDVDTVRITTNQYHSTHTITIIEIHPLDLRGRTKVQSMMMQCTFTLSDPLPGSVVEANDRQRQFVVTNGGSALAGTQINGYLEFLLLPALVYHRYAYETDFLHVTITPDMQMKLQINTGETMIPKDSFIGITALDTELQTDGFEMSGFVYHKLQQQLLDDVDSEACTYKRSTLTFDLYELPPGMYKAVLLGPDRRFYTIPFATHVARAREETDDPIMITFHSRQHTTIGAFTNQVPASTQNMTIYVHPRSSTDYEIVVTVGERVKGGRIQLWLDGEAWGTFTFEDQENDKVVRIRTLANRLVPGYYDINYMYYNTQTVLESMRVYVGIYMPSMGTIDAVDRWSEQRKRTYRSIGWTEILSDQQ